LWSKLNSSIMSQHAFSECELLLPPFCQSAPSTALICHLLSCLLPRCCSLHVTKLFFACRYTLLKGLELSKAAAHGLNKVLGDQHDKSREAKNVYRGFLSKKQVLLPASPSADQGSRAGAAAAAAMGSPASSARAVD
jgi:hypothetical protein